jgi:nitrogenase molybdenum-iron protein alpha/beta subunit
MTTLDSLITQCKKENPKIITIVNGEETEVTGADYEDVCKKWAEMRMEQIAFQANQEVLKQAEAQAKANAEAKLAALGLTTDDLKALGL